MIKVFLSHKKGDGEVSRALVEALSPVLRSEEIFRSEEIPKAKNYREKINQALAQSKFLIFLYTDPDEDWSWCFYEVGCAGVRCRSLAAARMAGALSLLAPSGTQVV